MRFTADKRMPIQYSLRMQRGFSLVEISLVLVILGLLVGGVLGGQSLIKASQLRAQMKDFALISSMHHAFRDKYLCIPGDCRNVSTFQPSIADGNGDSRVDCWPATGTNECATYMLTMEAEGMLEPRRAQISSAPEYRGGRVNSSVTAAYIHYGDRYPGGGYTPANLFGFGSAWIHFMAFNSPFANGPALRPEDAWNFDIKTDDGKPYSGGYLSAAGGTGGTYLTTCVNGSSEYMLNVTDVTCRSFIKIE